MWVSDGGIGCPPVLGSRLSAKGTRPSYQIFFRKRRFSGGDVCEVAPVPRLNVKNNLHHVRNTIHYGSLLRYGHTNMSTKEKSLLASLVITLLVFGNFFLNTLELALADEPIANIGTSLINVVISVIILEIIVQSLLASLSSSQEDDERDLLIERISFRNGYVCLSVGIWIWIAQTTIPIWWVDLPQTYLPEALVPVVLLLLFVIAEVTVTVTRLFYYRRGF